MHVRSDAEASGGVPQLTRAEKVFTLLGALLGMLLAALDQTIVATAGPAIQADLHVVARFGKYKALIMASLMLLIIGYAVMAFTLSPQSSQTEVTLQMILVGIGLGPAMMAPGAAPGVDPDPASGAASGRVAAEGSEGNWTFPAGEMKAKIQARFEAQRAQASRPDVRDRLASDEARALAAVDRAHDAFRWSFTDAISTVFRLAIGIAVLALVIVIFLPELPLRRTLGPPPMAE